MKRWPIRAITSADADAGRRNMRLLLQLRWLAVAGQLLTILLVERVMGIELPVGALLLAPIGLAAINIGTLPVLYRRQDVSNTELTVALLVDVAALAWQLHLTGGMTNPFVYLFLLQVVLAAVLLKPATAWGITAAALLALLLLALTTEPLALPPRWAPQPMELYLLGSLVCFAMVALLLVAFVTRVSRNLSDRDAALAASRQRAAEEDHIVRMALLASGAAHELGTPLSSMAVLVGDWKKLPLLSGNHEMQEDLADMTAAIARCKAIVSGILASAGEARGIAPQPTSARQFMVAIVNEWRADRRYGSIAWTDRLGDDAPMLADPALRQVIGNAIDNALDVSPDWVGIHAMIEGEMLVLEISDRGPGFTPEMLSAFGRPYHSTKGKPGGGLGLFLLVNVIRKLGGAVTGANRAEGGALVRISLPLAGLAGREVPA
ncbi:HAMP domain-containing histidine kinase [Sandaracinobacter neustonicus]|uniref:histidine kinase n=1 Tax=Sandaracinobacter neustonicus TaxID=1715348 RepID=A0A501XWT3_9SPHN|nr:ATP-binding protein [Sandaracinobacter neustonicus]TPE65066.1 HAMP domain-containing histidine kinase [Sandaracinobacter neustonicus]